MNNRAINQKEETNQFIRRLSPITKLSTPSRPFSRIKSVTGQRKKPWNKRFIYNKIPDYYSIKDKNVINAQKLRMYSVKKNNVFDTNYITYQQSKMNQTKKNPIKSFNRTMSGFFSHYSRGINNDFSTRRNIISPLTNTAFHKNNLMKNSNINLNINVNINDENYNKIKILWNELCVFPSYRELFIIIYNQLSVEEKEQLLKKELDELIAVKSDIKTLTYYIEQRNIVLKDLYEENTKLNKNKNDKVDEILIEISNLIEKLRETTIDVCYAMKKLKNDINNVNNLSKYNFDLLAGKSKFDKNYLIKMKSEIAFLKEGNAKYYFNFTDDRTPFLLKASEANINMINNFNMNNNNDKDFFIRIVPLKQEIKEHISECNYYIYQELIAYQQNIMSQQKVYRCVSPLKSINIMENKDNDISLNNLKSFGLNESLYPRIKNKNVFNDFSDINSVVSSKNIFGEKKLKGVQNLINQRLSARKNKDLFSQKLLSGYIPGVIEDNLDNLLVEDEKVKDEEEEEEEEKSENDLSKKEINDLIEEKKTETENNENTKTNNNGEDKKNEETNINNIDNNEEEINSKKNISKNITERSNISKKEQKNNSKLNKDINEYLNSIGNNHKNEFNNIDNFDKKENNISEEKYKDSKSNLANTSKNNVEINHIDKNEDNNAIEKTISNKEDKNSRNKEEEFINNKEENKNDSIKEKKNPEVNNNINIEIDKNNNIENKNDNVEENINIVNKNNNIEKNNNNIEENNKESEKTKIL